MTNTPLQDAPLDAFSGIDMDKLKARKSAPSERERKAIEVMAEQHHFPSREAKPLQRSNTIKTKSFALYSHELALIARIQAECVDFFDPDKALPSASDIVRSGLAALHELPQEDRMQLINRNKGRARR